MVNTKARNLLAIWLGVSFFFSPKLLAVDHIISRTGLLASSDKNSSGRLLHGRVNTLGGQAFSEYASLGFLCVREGLNELPAKVTEVALNGAAYKQGMRTGDTIFVVSIEQNRLEFNIERESKKIKVVFSGPLVANLANHNDNLLKSSADTRPVLQEEVAKSAPNFLQGGISESHLAALVKYSPFGFICAREGKSELPAKVSNVILNSLAYEQGLKIGDRVLEAEISNNVMKLQIEREGKPYEIYLSTEHPFVPLEISNTSLRGVIQKNYGDCWFEATAAAVALSPKGQKLISNMITKASPSLYYVNFLDQPKIAYRVDLSAPQAEQFVDKALWAKILERACFLRLPPQQIVDSLAYTSLNTLIGGSLERVSKQAMEMLTGKRAGQAVTKDSIAIPPDSLALSLDQMAEIINRAVANHEPVIIVTKGARSLKAEYILNALKAANIPFHLDRDNIITVADADRLALLKISNSIPNPHLILWGDHVYTVIGFDAPTKMIILRNPYGSDKNPSAVKPPLRGKGQEDLSGLVDDEERKRCVEDLGEGQIKVKLDVIYPYIRKLLWTVL